MKKTEKEGENSQITDIRRNNMKGVQYKSIDIPSHVKRSIRGLIEYYNLRYASVDMAIDNLGKWVFFEVNPNGQWAWLDIEADTNIAKLIIESLRRKE